MFAIINGHTNGAFLLQLPVVKATIDHTDQVSRTSLSDACGNGHQLVVQLFLDAGADPTIHPGEYFPINQVLCNNHDATAALIITPSPRRGLRCRESTTPLSGSTSNGGGSSSWNPQAQGFTDEDFVIFDGIERGDLEAVQQRVLANLAALEVRCSYISTTPLMCAIEEKKHAIALWLMEHWGQHDLDSADVYGNIALHCVSMRHAGGGAGAGGGGRQPGSL